MKTKLMAIGVIAVLASPAAAQQAPRSAQYDCSIIQRGVAEALVTGARVANGNNKRLLETVLQELARRSLTRAQIRQCSPQEDLLIAKIEQCAAGGDTECRFSQREADEFNKSNAVKETDGCPGIQRGATEALNSAVTDMNGDLKRFLETVRHELAGRSLTRAQIRKCLPEADVLIAKAEQCAARNVSNATECIFSKSEVGAIAKLQAKSTLERYENLLRSPHSGRDCIQGRAYGEPMVSPPPIDFEGAVAEFGKQRTYNLLVLAINWLSSCALMPTAPDLWSDRRLIAMVLAEAALPVKVIGTDASVDCESLVNARKCSLWVYYRIENLTEDITFTSVAVGCLGQISTPQGTYRLANVQHDPIVGNPLGPREVREFSIWYGVGHLGFRFDAAQVKQWGSSRWCHLLAARSKSLPEHSRVPSN